MKIIPARRSQDPITVFFDGHCLLCNATVDWLMRRDDLRQLKFATLQSPRGQGLQQRVGTLDSVLVTEGSEVFSKSDAVLRLAEYLGGWPRLLSWLGVVIPRILRDRIYDAIAANRQRWFGSSKTCRRPSPDDQDRFLE